MAFGIDDAITAVANLADDAIKRIWPDATETERLKATALAQELQHNFSLALAQIDINKTEASSASLFVSGWRPAVGWVGALGYGYEFLLRPIVNGVLASHGVVLPGIETEALTSLLFGLLGLGTLRTVERVRGVHRA